MKKLLTQKQINKKYQGEKMTKDLIYTQNALFTTFYAQTKEGEVIEQEMIRICGLPKVLNMHAQATIKQIRKAGYTVAKAKEPTAQDWQNIFKEMQELGL
jgi:hypothetical protein